MADSFDNFKPVYSAFGDHPRTPVTSTPSQNVPSLFSDYGQQLEGQGLFGPLQSSSSSGFAASGSNYAMDDYSFQNYSTSSVYDMSTRPLSPTNSSTGGGGPGNQVCLHCYFLFLHSNLKIPFLNQVVSDWRSQSATIINRW